MPAAAGRKQVAAGIWSVSNQLVLSKAAMMLRVL